MNVLLIGSGGREHALAWKLRQSPLLKHLHSWPRHPVIEQLAPALPVCDQPNWNDIAKAASQMNIDLVVVGPEVPLAEGLADILLQHEIAVFGPKKSAARIESSKAYAKGLMKRAGIPTADFDICDSLESARACSLERLSLSKTGVVIKASGLAAGKGVFVCRSREDINRAMERLASQSFDGARSQIVVEELLEGRECSYFSFIGKGAPVSLGFAVDYKRLKNDDQGPNTGGMGCYTPVPWLPENAAEQVLHSIVSPLMSELKNDGVDYQGCLYVGLMWGAGGPKVVEFNCRLGDPEAQILAISDNADWLDLMAQKAGVTTIRDSQNSIPRAPAVGIVLASKGYPFESEDASLEFRIPAKAFVSLKPEWASDDRIGAFASSVSSKNGNFYAGSGRVLCMVAKGSSIPHARNTAYQQLESLTEHCQSVQFRTDIAGLID